MIFHKLEVGIYGVNAYILGDERTKEAVVVDPGGNSKEIHSLLMKEKLTLQGILLTHAHGDHIGGIEGLIQEREVPVYVHERDQYILRDADLNYSSKMPMEAVYFTNSKVLKDGDILNFGNLSIKVLHTPGHSPGGCTFLIEGYLITGDTLFKGSIGRTDLEGGDHEQLINSIKEKLLTLEKDFIVCPGHGPKTTLEEERRNNPFL
ncbi:MBL fold metallo-hydrolase [Isachenkonia alkalipeptolytica]|uniref:MBL fold metallo-hydrolase n=1 Tax=Isachenkonia alkalipeptolytica TaxID=2565777 RepID=A0AA43XM53_9CLOT|nr:MBL fold metallo-hydrolase [Isachenkonia alkalipeptolytica]NBG88911.1 MBL fold metallo-hydrolase [Isachenkonia alkalipeptolytica]